MAAIALSHTYGLLLGVLLTVVPPLHADRIADVRAQITYVASALADSNPADALVPFDKSFTDYEKLSQYFSALTTSFNLVSEVEILDEDDAEDGTNLKVSWALEISDRVNSASLRRTHEVTVRLKLLKGKWKIVGFTPVEMFNPQTAVSAQK